MKRVYFFKKKRITNPIELRLLLEEKNLINARKAALTVNNGPFLNNDNRLGYRSNILIFLYFYSKVGFRIEIFTMRPSFLFSYYFI